MTNMLSQPRIRVLDEATASRIAAGEVVERPANVVKELLENSLDAGATVLDIEIQGGGKRLVRVVDNGRGISMDQVADAFARHATSKIRDASDLASVTTLGFRGEALAAIASVSRTTMVTRPHHETAGTRLEVVGARMGVVAPAGAPPGTSVTVEDLFFAVPARLKFLASDATEAARVTEVVGRVAMANPGVRITLTRDGKRVLASPGNGSRQDAVAAVLGRKVAEELLNAAAATDRTGGLSVSGLVSPPHLHKATRRDITLLVNGRWIQDNSVTFAVWGAYATLLPKSRFPVAVLWIDIEPNDVDVNVHPAKAEVRFRDPTAVFSAVRRAVAGALGSAPIAPVHDAYGRTGAWGGPEPGEGGRAARGLGANFGPDRWALTARLPGTQGAPGLVREHAWSKPGFEFGTSGSGTSGSGVGAGDEAGLYPATFSRSGEDRSGIGPLRPLGQVALTYLVAEGADGLVLIDQHAAHERVLYEAMMERRGAVSSQGLLAPEVVQLTPREWASFEVHRDALSSAGFDVESFGDNAVALRAVPDVATTADAAGLLLAVLDGLDGGIDLVATAAHERIASVVCKRASVKAGQAIGPAEARALIEALEATASPRTCPHGRPTMVAFSRQRLEKEFGRT